MSAALQQPNHGSGFGVVEDGRSRLTVPVGLGGVVDFQGVDGAPAVRGREDYLGVDAEVGTQSVSRGEWGCLWWGVACGGGRLTCANA